MAGAGHPGLTLMIFILFGIIGLAGLRRLDESAGFGLGEFTSTLILLFFVTVGSVALFSVLIAGVLELSRLAGLI